jgi:predicted Zn-dependent peptidase
VVYTTADSNKFDEILGEVEQQLERAIRGEIAAAEVDEAKTALRGRWLLGMEGNGDFAWWLAEMSLFTPEGTPLPDAFAELNAVSAADVARVARAYLSGEKRYQAIHRPGLTPARLVRPAAAVLGLTLAGLGVWLLARSRKDQNSIDRSGPAG